MELLSVFVDSYQCLENLTLNFSNIFSFEFSANNLKISQKDYIRTNFFGKKITNLSAIIGENGSGKSTILDMICNGRTDIEIYLNLKINSLVFFATEKYIHIEITNNSNLRLIKKLKTSNSSNHVKFQKLLFLSTVYDGKSYDIKRPNNPKDRLINLSTNYLIRAVSEIHAISDNYGNSEGRTYFDNIERFELDELIREIKLLSIKKYKFPFEVPKELTIQLSNNINTNDTWRKYLDKIIQNKMLLVEKVLLSSVLHYAYNMTEKRSIIDFPNICDDVCALIDEALSNNENSDLFSKIYNKTSRLEDLFKTKFGDQLKDFVVYLEACGYNKMINDKINVNFKNNNDLIAFLNLYFHTIIETGYFDFKWVNLSTGQKSLINLLSRFTLYNISFQRKQRYPKINNKALLILIDEGESHFHPMWQKFYITWLTDFLNTFFRNENIQVILTSNSPLILSDLPSENVIYIKRKLNQKTRITNLEKFQSTFGANIHTLLTDSFFMKDGLIGEFAKKKITELFNEIKSYNEIDTETYIALQNRINIIGEPIIKEKLLNLIQSKILKNDLTGRRSFLEDELKKLDLLIKKTKNEKG